MSLFATPGKRFYTTCSVQLLAKLSAVSSIPWRRLLQRLNFSTCNGFYLSYRAILRGSDPPLLSSQGFSLFQFLSAPLSSSPSPSVWTCLLAFSVVSAMLSGIFTANSAAIVAPTSQMFNVFIIFTSILCTA